MDNSAPTTEEIVLAAAAEVGGVPVDAGSDLIALGFDSVAMIELATRLTEKLGAPCTIEDIFDSVTLADLVALLDRRLDGVRSR